MTEALTRLTSSAKLMLAPEVRTLASSAPSRRFFSLKKSLSSPSLSCSQRSFATIMNNDHKYDSNVEEIFAKKRYLRSQIRNKLKIMSPSQRAEEGTVPPDLESFLYNIKLDRSRWMENLVRTKYNAIQNVVLEAPWFQSAKGLCAYVNCDALREVDTSKLLSSILFKDAKDNCSKNRKKLYLPRIEDKNSNMKMLCISSYDGLISNTMNIAEPTLHDHDGNEREDLMQASEPVDLFIIPGLAFDKSGRRLGRSGGYYDLYLKRYFELLEKNKWKPPLIVALAYSIQIVEDGAIGATSDDVPVDAVVCPAGVIHTNEFGKNL